MYMYMWALQVRMLSLPGCVWCDELSWHIYIYMYVHT